MSLALALQAHQLRVPTTLIEGMEIAEQVAAANEVDAAHAMEWLAEMFDVLPFSLPRATCSNLAESTFRRLACMDDSDEAWMPFGTMGPLLLCAHYSPTSEAFWGIPRAFIIPVLVPQVQYDALCKDVLTRLALKPLPERPRLELASPLPEDHGLHPAFDWLIDNYPFDDDERIKLRRAGDALKEEKHKRISDFTRVLPKNYSLAINYLARGELCFNAEHAPAQEQFPDALLEKHNVYPLFAGKRRVYLLCGDRNIFTFEDEWLSLGNEAIPCVPVLADAETITAAIARNRGRSVSAAAAELDSSELSFSDAANTVEIDPGEVNRINPANINVTPEQVIHWVLYRCMTGRASDLHVEKYFNTARFRARIDGELKVIHSCSEDLLPRFISVLKNYANMGQRRQDAQDARFSMRIGTRRIDCRVSAIPCRRDLQKITIRFLDKQDGVKKLTELNLSERQMNIVRETMGRDQGLVLVTGPTGSGKTTTLYALLNAINAQNINIHTIEDPIEYEIEGLNQTQTDKFNGIDFPEGLRRLLRADPDVILIGECRDEETATAAVNAALTGHLVLTTLHANDCFRAVSRLLAMGIPSYLLADALALTQAQRLVRRLCVYCKVPVSLTPELHSHFERNGVPVPAGTEFIYGAGGCPECGEGGYTGRMALMEMCPIDASLSDLVAKNAPQMRMREIASQRGVRTLYQEGLAQTLVGQTSLDEISCLSYTAISTDD